MHKITLFILAAVFAVALAEGQYYVPRAYYTIDAEGHESARVPLRRLRRSLQPYPYASGANANANADADAESDGDSTATANANAHARARAHHRGRGNDNGDGNRGHQGGNGDWTLPSGNYGATNPAAVRAGMTRRQYGPVQGRSVTASSSVALNSSGEGYYDQSTSVDN